MTVLAKAAKRPLILTILDGWGYSSRVDGNAIALARKPVYDSLLTEFPHTLIHTSGPFVGLPQGQMGNSEVGHLNMGAGRVIHMDVTRIDSLIASGEFFSHPVLLDAMKRARGRRLHLMGLVSDGGVHAQLTHLFALLKLARQQGLTDVFVHCFMDGRDTAPESGAGYVEALLREMKTLGVGRIASISGRYWAMDRDKSWDRIEKAFTAMRDGVGEKATDPIAAIKRSYEKGITDEFIEPVTVVDEQEQPIGLIREGDVTIDYNYRSDRGRQITKVLFDSPLKLHVVTMTQYDKSIAVPFVLPPEHPNNILADVMATMSWKNLRVAETEKYAHVTYFFNGGNERPYAGEEREMVPSPKVATYDLRPEMSAAGVADVVTKAIANPGNFDVVVMNFANADMVGHSGKLVPTIAACETVDTQLGRIYAALKQYGGSWIITADHGNAETMIDPVTGGPHTYHTTNPVPFLVVSEDKRPMRQGGALQDIAPTVLGMLQVEQPKEMKGKDLHSL